MARIYRSLGIFTAIFV